MNIFPSRFYFGKWDEKPRLREGWQWIEAPDDFLKVRDPEGSEWFCGTEFLTRAKVATAKDAIVSAFVNALRLKGRRLKINQEYCDERELMLLRNITEL